MTGNVKIFGGSSVPTGFFLCNGQAISRTTYANLFAAIGTTYGSGDGSTTFNVPNLVGKSVFGQSSDTEFTSLNQSGGAETLNLAHSHTMNTHSHSFSSGSTGGPSATIQRSSGSQVNAASSTHTHSVSAATIGNQSDAGTNSQLSSSQSVLNPYNTANFIIET